MSQIVEEMVQRPTDEGFSFNNRLMLSKQFTVVPKKDLTHPKPRDLSRTTYELDKAEHILGNMVPEKEKQLIAAAVRLSQYNIITSKHLTECAAKEGIAGEVPSLAEISDSEDDTSEPSKKCVGKCFLKMGHQLSANQILFIDVRSNYSEKDNTDLVFRSGRGEVLARVANCNPKDIQRKLVSKLRVLPRQDSFCAFVSKHPTKTLDFAYFTDIADKNIDFLYIHLNFHPQIECLPAEFEGSIFCCVANPNIYVWRWKEHTVVGSSRALAYLKDDNLDELLDAHNHLLKEENFMLGDFLANRLDDLSISWLRFGLYNLIQRHIAEGSKSNMEEVICESISYCLSKARLCHESRVDNSRKMNVMHYPNKLKHCKECRVCLKTYNDWTMSKRQHRGSSSLSRELQPKKRKSKYECEACSAIEEKPVALCVTCFKEYHLHMQKYTDKYERVQNSNVAGFASEPVEEVAKPRRGRPPNDRYMHRNEESISTYSVKREEETMIVPPQAEQMGNHLLNMNEMVSNFHALMQTMTNAMEKFNPDLAQRPFMWGNNRRPFY